MLKATLSKLATIGLVSVPMMVNAAMDSIYGEMPVVLSSGVLEQARSSSPLKITVIDRQMIEASGARSIPEALRLIPGIVIGHSVNDFGNKPLYVVAYHGHSDQFSTQMNVLIDGRSIYDPLQGGVDWYGIPIAMVDIERIEFTHGPNVTTYGTNSFQAVINVITRRASEDQGHLVKMNIGNHDVLDTVYRYASSSGDLDYRVTVAGFQDDGQDRAGGDEAIDDVEARSLDYRFDLQVDNSTRLSYQGGYGQNNQDADGTLRPATLVRLPSRTVEDERLHHFLRLDSTIDNDQSVVIKYYYNRFDERDRYQSDEIDLSVIDPSYAPFDPLVIDIDQSYRSERHKLEYIHYYAPMTDLDLTWGLSHQIDAVDSSYHFDPTGRAKRHTDQLFASAVIGLDERNSLNIGLMAEKSDDSDTDVSPRIAYFYQPSSIHTFRVGVSQAVRTPFLFEQYGQVRYQGTVTLGGTPVAPIADFVQVDANDIVTEKITSIEFGYHGLYLDDSLEVNARIFMDELDDLLDAPNEAYPIGASEQNGSAFTFDNLHATRVAGIELDIDIDLTRDTRIFSSLSLIDIESRDAIYVNKSSELEESAPERSFSFLLMQEIDKYYSGSVGYYYASDYFFTDANNTDSFTMRHPAAGVNKLDLRLVRNEAFGVEDVQLALIMQNLLDDYSDYDASRNTPRGVVVQNTTVFLEASIRFR